MNPKTSKLLVDMAGVGHDSFMFAIIFACGEKSHGFAMNPPAAKAFYENLGRHIADYEAKHGPLDTKGLNMGTVSPFQPK